MKEYFFKMLQYNEWANNQVLNALVDIEGECPEEITRLFNHIVSAQMNWLSRILDKQIINELWKNNSIEGCITLSKESSKEWLRFVEGLKDEDLSRVIVYKNTKGIQFENTIEDILIHLINHSTYHRAQIAMSFRKSGLTPPVTDYIVYRREAVRD